VIVIHPYYISSSTSHPNQVQKFNVASKSSPENSKVFKLEIFAVGRYMNQKHSNKTWIPRPSESKRKNSTLHPNQVQKFNFVSKPSPENSKMFKLEIFAVGRYMNQKNSNKTWI